MFITGHEMSHGAKSIIHDDSLGIRPRDEVTAHSLAMDSLFRYVIEYY